MEDGSRNIYKISKMIKRRMNDTLYNALRSIYEDSVFVGEIYQLWPELPLLANLRCGLWYSRKFDGACYFKSTDGHTNNLSFSIGRLNLHVAELSAQRGGCIIVDSTRKGKKFPDSMSKTIPIWTCVLNRAVSRYRKRCRGTMEQDLCDWDCFLHLPLWVSEAERRMIENRLESWTDELEASGADIGSISSSLRKPLRPLWISQTTVIWLNEVPDHDSWDFTPVILVSASCSSTGVFRGETTSEFSWNYIAGAGDDEESWARGLTPHLFWQHAHEIVDSGPDSCNQLIAGIVERERVRHLRSGEIDHQVSNLETCNDAVKWRGDHGMTNLGSTNIAVGKTQLVGGVESEYCILNCDSKSLSTSGRDGETYLHLPIVDSKFDRFSLLRNLPSALEFAKRSLRKSQPLFICCSDGEDISVCVCLAILTSLCDETGKFDEGESFSEMKVTKAELRKRLVFICKYAVNARPSRGNLRQVFACLSKA